MDLEIIDLEEMQRKVGLKHDEIVNHCPNCGKKEPEYYSPSCSCGFDFKKGRNAKYMKNQLESNEYMVIQKIEHAIKGIDPFLITNHVRVDKRYHPVITVKNQHVIELGCSDFQEIPESLGDLTYLWNLNVGGSRFSLDLLDVFQKFTRLEWLNLEDCNLSFFPNLRPLNRLKRLKMKHNKLLMIPEWIDELGELTQLHFRLNKISEIPATLGNLKHLKWLNLNDNDIEVLPKSIGGLESLEELEINGNRLEVIPREIKSLKNLKRLNISRNNIEMLPSEIGNLLNLTSLDISNNPIKVLPETIGKLKKLTFLNIKWTRLDSLPESLLGLDSLEEIVWDSEQFDTIPLVLKKLSKRGVELYPAVWDDEDFPFERLNMNFGQIREFIERMNEKLSSSGCNHTFDNFDRSLEEIGITKSVQKELHRMCIELSAFCDCEVLMNAANSLLGKEPAIFYDPMEEFDEINKEFDEFMKKNFNK